MMSLFHMSKTYPLSPMMIQLRKKLFLMQVRCRKFVPALPLKKVIGVPKMINPFPADYKWSHDEFMPPNNIEFCGNTKQRELPTDRAGEVTPYGILKMFITDEMLQSVADETNRYSVEKDGRSVNTSRQELEKLIGMFYYMGLVQVPSLRSYWESELRYEAVAKVMSRDLLLKLVTVLHFVDNSAITDEEKLDKL